MYLKIEIMSTLYGGPFVSKFIYGGTCKNQKHKIIHGIADFLSFEHYFNQLLNVVF